MVILSLNLTRVILFRLFRLVRQKPISQQLGNPDLGSKSRKNRGSGYGLLPSLSSFSADFRFTVRNWFVRRRTEAIRKSTSNDGPTTNSAEEELIRAYLHITRKAHSIRY